MMISLKNKKKGTVTDDDIPVVRKMNNNEKLTDEGLIGYILMLNMGIVE